MKKLIINADDFGYSNEVNEAVKLGFFSGFLTSASLLVNMPGFDNAVYIIPSISDLDIGIHLNIIEGKSISSPTLLTDKNNNFNNSFASLFYKSYDKKFMAQTEEEFRAQIELALRYSKLSHIDSHVHVHAIPEIFKLVLKLAKEYEIPFIRTQHEIPYFVPKKSLNLRYPVNIIKNVLLNFLTIFNKKPLKKTDISTNDNFIGVLYTGSMDEKSILEGLKKIKSSANYTEIIIHPYVCKNPVPKSKQDNYIEFLTTQNMNLLSLIQNSNFVLSRYSDLSAQN